MDYTAQYSLNDLVNNYDGKINLAEQVCPPKTKTYFGSLIFEAIPEPSALALIGLGAMSSIALSRLKVRKPRPLDYLDLDKIDFPRKKK